MEKISVLMSLYIKEKPSNLIECMESLLKQTVLPSEIVIVKDGPLTDELNECIEDYVNKYPSLIKVYPLEKNQGLGLALRFGVTKCENELIARMDTDDICKNYRFKKQLREFENDKDLKITGSHITEFENDISNIISTRKVPLIHKDIVRYQKRRSAFNHATVMFKKSAVLEAGNYENALYMEDDILWSRMLIKDMKAKNLDESLIYSRSGLDLIQRRGGLRYLSFYKAARKSIYKMGFISFYDYYLTVLAQVVVCLIPKSLRVGFFKKILRSKEF